MQICVKILAVSLHQGAICLRVCNSWRVRPQQWPRWAAFIKKKKTKKKTQHNYCPDRWHHQYVFHPVWWPRSPCFGQTVHFWSTGSSRVITEFISDSEPSVMFNVIMDVLIYTYEKYCQLYKDQREIRYLSIGVRDLFFNIFITMLVCSVHRVSIVYFLSALREGSLRCCSSGGFQFFSMSKFFFFLRSFVSSKLGF